MCLNIAVENLVGFAVGSEVHHVSKTRGICWNKLSIPARIDGPFHSNWNVIANIIPGRNKMDIIPATVNWPIPAYTEYIISLCLERSGSFHSG